MSRRRATYVIVAESVRVAIEVDLPVLSAEGYLEGEGAALSSDLVVVNLCRSYQYLSRGYYVSLLAEARGQRALPSLRAIESIGDPYTYIRAVEEAGLPTIEYRIRGRRLLPRVIVPEGGTDGGRPAPLVVEDPEGAGARYRRSSLPYREVTAIFGRPREEEFRRLTAAVFRVLPFPILRVRFYRDSAAGWRIGQILPGSLHRLEVEEHELLSQELKSRRFAGVRQETGSAKPPRIACLWDAADPFAPSDQETLERFEREAGRRGARFETIGKTDLDSLPEYDALLIRTTTAIDHYSFTFAQRAESLGIPVIDDPISTLRCSNKVYLYELFRRSGLPMPRTVTISRGWRPREVEELGYPLIVKQPDGTFSAAVKKAKDAEELQAIAAEMFRRSPLLVVQEYIPTAFDWRVGVLEGKVLYMCKYFMVKGHWQIVGRSSTGRPRYGRVEAVPIGGSPEDVRSLAVEAASRIGDGLYGVDVKETAAGPLVIEVNDNPDIWVGEEDGVENDRLYGEIIASLLRRIQVGLALPAPSS